MRRDTEESPVLGRRAKILGVASIALVVGLLLLELLVLRGEQVAGATVGLGPDDVETLLIDRVGEKHLVEVQTHRRRRGKTEGRAVEIRLEDPNGELVYETGEWASRKERFFSFTPVVAGSYRITVRPGGVISGSSSGTARVKVLVGDRRFLSRLMAFLPF